ncbi:MAG: alpha/beta hydrolase [Candidatus Obscuribacterales bacterium]|nr:alpha/beta hydrolase [Candidatus Obscuribacterales bacterium]
MEQASQIGAHIRTAAIEYLTPNSMRKVVRRPKVDLEAQELLVPFKGGNLAARLWGEGETILLVHGWAANQTDMFSFVPEITSRGLRAVAIDLPAHGESTGEIAGLEELGQGVLAIGEKLGHLKGVIAHSVGGAATQLAIVNGLDVERAVMLASPEDYELGVRQFGELKGFSQQETALMIEVLKEMNVRLQIRSADLVPEIKVPALIVHSKDDSVVPFSIAQNLCRYWRDSSILEVDGLKHRGLLKDPTVIREAVTYLTK